MAGHLRRKLLLSNKIITTQLKFAEEQLDTEQHNWEKGTAYQHENIIPTVRHSGAGASQFRALLPPCLGSSTSSK